MVYSLGDQLDKSLQVAIGGVALNSPLHFSQTKSDVWATNAVTVTLHAGQNDIILIASENDGLALDYLDLEPMEQRGIQPHSSN